MRVDGHDHNPGAWPGLCDPPGASKPGILIDDLDNVDDKGNALETDGIPPMAEDPSLTPEDLLTFGDLTWDELVQLAEKVYAPNYRARTLEPDSMWVGNEWVCNEGLETNWGAPTDPTNACGSYFPIIYTRGDLTIAANGRGQGILLIQGDLTITGAHTFYGPVIIRGTLWASGGGAISNFVGGVTAANIVLDDSRITGNALIEYSSCAVNRAILNNSALTRVRPIENRSWVDLSSVISG
ncbi:hypothetical protein ACFL0I_03975 [Gemmatimonadota bacterium]